MTPLEQSLLEVAVKHEAGIRTILRAFSNIFFDRATNRDGLKQRELNFEICKRLSELADYIDQSVKKIEAEELEELSKNNVKVVEKHERKLSTNDI